MKHKNAIVIRPDGGLTFGLSPAAMILRGLNGAADVLTSEQEGLVDLLEREGRKYARLFVVNVPFRGDETRAENVLRALKKEGAEVLLADNAISRSAGAPTRRLHDLGLIAYFTKDGSDLRMREEVERRFGVSAEDLDGLGDLIFGNFYAVSSTSALEMAETAQWFYECYGRADLFDAVVRALARKAKPDELPPALAKAIAHWRAYRRRGLTGRSAPLCELRRKIARLARFPDARVMILGESGTGKETVAMQLHYGSARRDRKFVAFNCATQNAELLESRLFGHEKGAFTGADRQTKGLFEEADGGTLFLDEIGEMKPELQGVLLRVLEEGRVRRVGGTEEFPVDVRLLTATNRDLPAMVKAGAFRADLYQRLAVVQIVVPPLREHKEDIPDIVSGWRSLRLKPNAPCEDGPTDEQIAALMDYDYPGNVRELLNILDRAAMLGETDWRKLMDEHRAINASLTATEPATPAETVAAAHPPLGAGDAAAKTPAAAGGANPTETLDAVARNHVRKVYEACGGNLTKAAAILDVSRNTVRKHLRPADAGAVHIS